MNSLKSPPSTYVNAVLEPFARAFEINVSAFAVSGRQGKERP